MALPSGGNSASNSETDASAQTSGNMTGNSADRVSQQFNNLGSGTRALDVNKYMEKANSGFYMSIAGEQGLESGAMGQSNSNIFKYIALGSALFIGLFAVVALKGRKS
jgi:hypothetical protein